MKNDQIEIEWAKLITLTTSNFGLDSRFLTYFQAINFHLVHSPFPTIGFVHYPKLCPTTPDICRDYNLSHREFPNARSAIYSHFAHLAKVSHVR